MIRTNFRINNWREVVLLSACFVLAGGVISSCKKSKTAIGTEALDVADLLASGGIDTFQLVTYSVDEDSIPTDYQAFGTLGAFHDPQLGIMDGSIYTQFNIGGKMSLTGGPLDVVDSVVLSLSYGGYYGKLDPQTFEVYELTEGLDINSTYYRFTTKTTTGVDLVEPASATQTPDTKNAVYVGPTGSDSLNPQLRLRLNNALGVQFVQDVLAGNSAFNSSAEFLSSGYFKGLKIKVANSSPAQGTGGLLYIKMGNQQTRLTVYFKLQGDITQRTLVFSLNNSATFFNHMDFNRTGHHVANVLANPAEGQTNFYAQRFGILGVIEVPTISNLSSKAVISNCLLSLPIAHHFASKYTPSPVLDLRIKNDEGNYVYIGGAAYESAQKSYVFDLRAYAQGIVSGKIENKPIYIFPSISTFTSLGDRVVFNGSATSYKTKPKLVLKYTEFK